MIVIGRRDRTRQTGASTGGKGHDVRSDGRQKHGEGDGVVRHGKLGRDKRSGYPSRHFPGDYSRGGDPNGTTKGVDTGVVARVGRAEFGRQADGNGGMTGQTDRYRVPVDNSWTCSRAQSTHKV